MRVQGTADDYDSLHDDLRFKKLLANLKRFRIDPTRQKVASSMGEKRL
jgi:hypothetical protein